MKKGQSKRNIEFSEHYDQEDDIYYVTFKTGEPSYVAEVDDILLLEVGIFSRMPTGFRILNFSKHKVELIEFRKEKIDQALASSRKTYQSDLTARTGRIHKALEKVLA